MNPLANATRALPPRNEHIQFSRSRESGVYGDAVAQCRSTRERRPFKYNYKALSVSDERRGGGGERQETREAGHGKHNVIKTRAKRGRGTCARARLFLRLPGLCLSVLGGDFLNFSGLILTAEPRVTPGKSSVPRTKPLIAPTVITFASAPRSRSLPRSSLNLFGTQNTPGDPETGSKLKLFN